MPKINEPIPSFLGGVSQQDPSARLPSQLEAAENCWFDPALGNRKRPPAQHVATLGSDIPADAAWHSIVRDNVERYIVCVYGGKVRVFDHDTGKEYTVASTVDPDYITTTKRPCDVFRMTTVADTTFITNKDVTVAMSEDTTPGYLSASVQTFEDLPKTASPGALYAVTGDPTNGFDQFYVQCQSSQVFNEIAKPGVPGTFDKTTMPHVLKRIPSDTNPDGFYFAFGPQDWGEMPAGDPDSNPPPSFVGQKIAGVVYFRERLGFISVENVILSEVGHPFNFWRTTVTQLLVSDPIDVAVKMKKVASLQHAVPFQRVLMLFANTGEYQLGGSEQNGLAPQTVHVDPVTNYQCSALVEPVVAGDAVIYLSEHGGYCTAREYFVQQQGVTNDAADITGQAPVYIPAPARSMATCADVDMVVVATEDDEAGQLYTYQYRWEGEKQVQAAWGRWKLSGLGKAVHVHQVDNYLYAVCVLPEGGCGLVKIDTSADPVVSDLNPSFDVHLDRRITVQGSYQALGNYTDFKLPYALQSLDGLVLVKGNDWDHPGALVDLTNASLQDGGQTVRLQGNVGDGLTVVLGLKYDHSFTLSRLYHHDQRGLPVQIGRLQLRTLTVGFTDTAYFKVTVARKARPSDTAEIVPALLSTYTGRTIGDSEFLLSAPELFTGVFRAPILTRSDLATITISNDSPYPSRFQSGRWVGLFTSRSPV